MNEEEIAMLQRRVDAYKYLYESMRADNQILWSVITSVAEAERIYLDKITELALEKGLIDG